MTREELIEVMARAILQDFEDGADMSTHPVPERAASRNARAALAAIETAGVVVLILVEPDDIMLAAGMESDSIAHHWEPIGAHYKMMVSASPKETT